jgi:hypothetical protein
MDNQSSQKPGPLDTVWICLLSKDGQEIYIDKMVANFSDVLQQKIRASKWNGKAYPVSLEEYSAEVIETVCQYLHFKARYIKTDFNNNPDVKFHIKPELGLEVLRAAVALKI